MDDRTAIHTALALLGEPDFALHADALRLGAAEAAWVLRLQLGVTAPAPELDWDITTELTCTGEAVIQVRAVHPAGIEVHDSGRDEACLRATLHDEFSRRWDAEVRRWAFARYAGTHAYSVFLGLDPIGSIVPSQPLGLDEDLEARVRETEDHIEPCIKEQISRWSTRWWDDQVDSR